MALIQSSLLSTISGSIGGTTYSRARGGAYARNKSIPIDPNTPAQNLSRSRLGDTSSDFNTLSRTQVEAWNEWALGFHVLNRLGESYQPSGRQAYMMLNNNLKLIGEPTISVPPANTDVPVFDIKFLDLEALTTADVLTTLTLTDSAGQAAAQNAKYLVQLSPPQIAARGQSYRNRMRGQGQFKSTLAANFDALNQYGITFAGGDPVPANPGQVIVFGARMIEIATGLSSSYFYKTANVL